MAVEFASVRLKEANFRADGADNSTLITQFDSGDGRQG
jgi:hypothetical protein